MILSTFPVVLLDVNVVVNAHREEAQQHAPFPGLHWRHPLE